MVATKRPKLLQQAVQRTWQNYAVAAPTAVIIFLLIPWWILCSVLYLGGILFLSCLIAPVLDEWRPRIHSRSRGKAVFITSCDDGCGLALVKLLDELGVHIFAGCLFPDKEGAKSLKKTCTSKLHIVPLDVTSDESVQNAVEYVKNNIGTNKFWALVNTADTNECAEFAWTSFETEQRAIDVSVLGVMRMTKAFIPLLCRDKGRVVTLVNGTGMCTVPGMVQRNAIKASITSFCENLRIELCRFEVRSVIIEATNPNMGKDNMLKYVTKAWDDSPDEVKQLYPENYLLLFKSFLRKFQKLHPNDKQQEVVNALERAVMAFDPKYVYSTEKLHSRFVYELMDIIPKPIADALIYDEYIVPVPVPVNDCMPAYSVTS